MSDSLDSKSPKKHAVSSRCVDMLRTVLLILMLMALLVWSLTGGLKNWYPKKSWEFPAIFWDVVGGTGVIFRGLDASIHASRPIWLLWCFDHDQFDDPLDVILQKCGRKCYFFPSGSLWLCRLLIFQKLGGKRWDFHHRGNRMPSAFAVPRPSWIFPQRYLWRWYGLNLTDSWTLESDIYQAGGFLGAAGFTPMTKQAMNPWLSRLGCVWPKPKETNPKHAGWTGGQTACFLLQGMLTVIYLCVPSGEMPEWYLWNSMKSRCFRNWSTAHGETGGLFNFCCW